MRIYSNSQISKYDTCNRQHLFYYILGLKGESKAPAPTFGRGWHKAMDVVWKRMCVSLLDDEPPNRGNIIKDAYAAFEEEWVSEGFPGILELTPEDEQELKARTPYTAIGMIEEYVDIRGDFLRDKIKLIAVEQPFLVPLDPSDDELWYCGVVDKAIEYQGRVYFVDHKTTSAYAIKGGFRSTFTESFSPDTQIDGYIYAGRMLYGDKFKGVFIDGALVHKKVHDKYCLLPIERQTSQLDSWLWETLDKIKRIEKDKLRAAESKIDGRGEYLPAFVKNTQNCYSFNTPCSYMDLCKAWANPINDMAKKGTPIGFRIDHSSPFDHIRLEELGIKREDVTETHL